MNKTYRTVWNESLGAWVAASEVSKARGKRSRSSVAVAAVATAALMGAVTLSTTAYAASYQVGGGTATPGQDAVAIGTLAFASGNNAVAYGAGNSATGGFSTAIGNSSSAGGDYSIAMGSSAIVVGQNAVGIGKGAIASNDSAVALGDSATANGIQSTAVGTASLASTSNDSAFGNLATASGGAATAIGSNSIASGSQATAIGAEAKATGPQSIAAGPDAIASGDTSAAFGFATASGSHSVAVGSNATAIGVGAQAYGDSATASAQDSIALGNTGTASAQNAVAIGLGATASSANSVALGSGSVTATAIGTSGVTIKGTAYTFAGTVPDGTVSVGVAGHERTITDVAAGRISATSTDAINGSELYATNQAIGALTTGGAGPVQYSNAGTPTTPNGGTATQDLTLVGAAAGAVTLHNVAPGKTGTDAVDVSQLQSLVTGLGGGAAVNSSTGAVTGPTYTVYNDDGTTSTVNNVGGAINAINANGIKYFHANSTGADSQALGTDSVAIGPGAKANDANDVALGSGSITAATVATSTATIGTLTTGTFAGTTPVATISVGAAGTERTITNVAAGRISATSTDAINGSELYQVTTGLQAAIAAGGGAGAPVDYLNVNATVTGPGSNTKANSGALMSGSVAIGPSAGTTQVADLAIGDGAHTVGVINADSGNIAIGSLATVNGGQAIGIGWNTSVSGAGSVALGSQSSVPGVFATLVGSHSQATADNSVVLGAFSQATAVQAVAVGDGVTASGVAATAVGNAAVASAANASAFGNGATASNAGDVALGSGSTTAAANPTSGVTIKGVPYTFAGATPTSVVSVGSAGNERQITNVAAGQITATSTDAINGSELFATNQAIGAITTGGAGPVQYSNPATPTVPNGGVASQDLTLVGAGAGTVTLHNVSAGISNTDAVNVSQLKNVVTGFGGGAAVDPITGAITGPTYTVYGLPKTDVGTAVAALQNNAPIQYSTSAQPTTGLGANGTPTTNDVTLVGPNAGSPVSLHNVAAGVAPTDAVNVSQLTNSTDAAANKWITGNPTTYASPTAAGVDSTAVGSGASSTGNNSVAVGNNSTDGGRANVLSVGSVGAERQVTNVAAGTQNTDAVNVSQLKNSIAGLGGGASVDSGGNITGPTYVTYNNDGTTSTVNNVGGAIDNINAEGIKYFHANSTGADSQALGLDSVAIGSGAKANNANDVALGAGSVTALAIGTSNATIAGNSYAFAGTSPVGTLSVGSAGAERTITNVAAGRLSTTSTDAINGSQLNATNLALNALNTEVKNLEAGGGGGGGTAPFRTSPDASGTPPVASGTTSVAGGNNAVASGPNSAAVGNNTLASGPSSTALGNGAIASNANDVALGSGSTTSAPHLGVTALYGNTAAGTANNNGAVSVGSAGNERQIQNVGAGVLSATSTDAVNGSQLYSVKTGVDALGASTASNLGGGSTYNASTGKVSAPTYNVIGGTVNNVGAAIDALQAKAPVQFSDPSGKATPLTPSNDVTLVGKDPTKPVAVHNVADGVAPTDAVNVEQLRAAVGDAGALSNEIAQNRKDASAGTAQAMAMANMPQPTLPGKPMVSAGIANYDGQSALSVGVSKISDNGRWVFKASGSAATNGKVGVGAGAGFQW